MKYIHDLWISNLNKDRNEKAIVRTNPKNQRI